MKKSAVCLRVQCSRGCLSKSLAPLEVFVKRSAPLSKMFFKSEPFSYNCLSKSVTSLDVCLSKNSAVLFQNVFVRECNASQCQEVCCENAPHLGMFVRRCVDLFPIDVFVRV
jgi:hypothetical protein